MAHCTYSDVSAFHWQSELSQERKEQLVAWVNSLSDEEQAMLQDLVQDSCDAGYEEGLPQDENY